MGRRNAIVITLFLSALAIAGLLFVVLVSRGSIDMEREPTVTTSPVQRFACELTGQEITGRRNPVTYAACIDNIAQARPQSGLDRADIVYEVLAEGGIPRFLAIYSCRQADRIGPIRSARTYFISLAQQFDAVMVHAGGSPQALSMIEQGEIRSLSQFEFTRAYYRDPERRRPHNLFTNTSRLANAAEMVGFTSLRDPVGPEFGERQIEGEPAETIVVPFPTTRVGYEYSPETGDYLRFMNREPHVDAVTGRQLRAKNIIIQFTEERVTDQAGRLDITLLGSGRALFFVDGRRVEGTWQRDSENQPFRYEDLNDREFEFRPGQTWVEIVSENTRVTSTSDQ